MLVSLIILTLYFWAYFADVKSIGNALLVSDGAAISAGAAFVVGFISYLWAPKKYIFWGSYGAFAVLCITSAILILSTGGTASPFLALWMIVSVFAGVFGLYGIIPLFIAVTAYLVVHLIGGTFEQGTAIAVVLAGGLPLVISFIIWHTKSSVDNTSDRAYRELASELSQVAGKSEVVINAIADGVIALNGQGTIQLINPAAQQIIGWGKQDALALDYKSVLKLVDKSDHDLTPANDPISQVLTTNTEMITNNLNLMTNSGKKLQVSVIVSPIGQLGSGVIVVFRDITNEKAEEREQAEFISTASHEMRTPVASIEGYLGLALNPATAQIDDKARDFINKAHESAQHLGRLFQDLLDVTKAEDGRMSDNPKVIDAVLFTHDIVQGLRPKAEQKGLRVLFKPLPDDDAGDNKDHQGGERRINPVFYANVDNDHLREILSNLVENAIKYTPKGDVVIDVTGDTDHITISIADSGIGIPKEDQTHLFQKFYRVDNSDTREIGGTGLGLYLCRRLAEAMNGRIWLDSEYKRGSTFYLEIPRISHEEATQLIESASAEKETISDVTNETFTPVPPVEPIQQVPTTFVAPTFEQTPDADTVYTNAPVATVVQQLQTINTAGGQPRVQPQPQYPQPQPTPQQQGYLYASQQPQYMAGGNPQQQTSMYPAQQPQTAPWTTIQPAAKPNTPLSQIEQNPNQYVRARPNGVSIPPRSQQ